MFAIRTVQSSLRPVDIVLVPFTARLDADVMPSSHSCTSRAPPSATRPPIPPIQRHYQRTCYDLLTYRPFLCPSPPPLRCVKVPLQKVLIIQQQHTDSGHRLRERQR